ncbi:alpha/beta fold hydrolase [Neorhizobium alkalisoli]|uniref:3-oxoadipate enol-lactonase n=1 Tax=Neorhizobium alkalisoli TaxID=528178 RepID=A0A561QAP3_9HYPH|nr:alpha/beta hydrolase [Neorhizobium alkalisoli]TWF47439.1 3-oxoadipate enol-lactonase [Neorhizobium alkalisoli]
MADGGLIEVNGTVLRYRRLGEGRTHLVLLHEMGGALESWDAVVPLLRENCRILSHDLRGFGQSEKIRGAIGFSDLTLDTAALIEKIWPGEKVWLAGCAVGGAVALDLAASRADLVAGVVAFAPATGVSETRREGVLERVAALEHDGLRAFFPQLEERQFPTRFRDDPTRVEQFRLRRLACDPHSYAAVWRAMASSDLEQRLDRIDAPVTIVAGSEDSGRPADQLRLLARQIRHCRFEVIDSGHAMPVISPLAVARIIRASISQNPV